LNSVGLLVDLTQFSLVELVQTGNSSEAPRDAAAACEIGEARGELLRMSVPHGILRLSGLAPRASWFPFRVDANLFVIVVVGIDLWLIRVAVTVGYIPEDCSLAHNLALRRMAIAWAKVRLGRSRSSKLSSGEIG
jgi:hypothetical protein